MVSKKIRYFLLCTLLLALIPTYTKAQENSTSNPTSEVELLRKRVEEQGAQIQRLEKMLETLQQKMDKEPSPPSTTAIVPEKTTTSNPPAKVVQSVESGYGKIKFNGLLQALYTGGNGGTVDTFKVRHAEMKFTGEITPEVKWTVMFDPAKLLTVNNTFTLANGTRVLSDTSVNQASRVLQDAFVTLDYFKQRNIHIDIGQFKAPLSMEGVLPPAKVDTIERALFLSDRARGGNLGNVRDVGVMVRGPFTKYLDYQIGLFNGVGESQNDLDRTDQKAVIARLVVNTPIKGLRVGGSGAFVGKTRTDRPRRDRFGGELTLSRGAMTFKTELMTGKDADIHRLGYYGHFAYRIMPKVEALFRYDVFDPDRRRENSLTNVTEHDYIAGVNYYVNENNVKLQVNYVRKTFAKNIFAARDLFLVNLQTSW